MLRSFFFRKESELLNALSMYIYIYLNATYDTANNDNWNILMEESYTKSVK